MDIFDYVDKYGDFTFGQKAFNEIDNLVFCSLSYLNFTYTSINNYDHTLEYIGREYLNNNTFNKVKKRGIPQKNGYKLLRKIVKKRRYKNVIIHDYVYSTNIEKQFSAMMFRIKKDLEYICFEGTDEYISGWKEDFELAYKFPIPSQTDAIKYANKHIKIHGPNVIIGGHSKGGNLALVAAMNVNPLKQFRVLHVYSNDGPGLRAHEFNSGEYRRIKRKLTHFVPAYSIVGILLRNDVMSFIKASKNTFMSHAIATWEIDDDHLIETKQSKRTSELMGSLLTWLKNHSDKQKQDTVEHVFSVFEDSKIEKFTDINSISNIKKILENIKNIDENTRSIIIDLIKFNFFDKN